MEKLKRVIRKEEFVSRLPALFAYIEDNVLGDSVLHSAYDSNMGCYGKVVENIMLPSNVSATVDGVDLLSANNPYSYRTIMDCYYNYHSSLNSEFLDFVDKAIGKEEVTFTGYSEDMDLVPEYVYLATVHSLYDEMMKMQKECNFYECRKPIDGEDAYMCCLCEKYQRMGGDGMVGFLSGLIDIAKERAYEYLGYAERAQSDESYVSATLGIQLTSSVNDLGIVKPRIVQWVAGDTYYSGDIVYYEGDAYICKYNGDETISTSGVYNPSTELIEFDFDNFTLLKPSVAEGAIIEGYTDSKLQSLRRYTNYLNEYGEEETPESGEDWLFYYRKGEIVNIETLNDDYGNIMRYKEPGENEINEVVDPYNNDGSDYVKGETATRLFAYGDVLYNIEATADNTITFTYYIGVHLIAKYAGCDTDDDGNYRYYFTDFQPDLDEVNNKHIIECKETYSYEDGSDLDALIKEGKFDGYVDGYYDAGGDGYSAENLDIIQARYEFNTTNNLVYYDKSVSDKIITLSTNITDFTSSSGEDAYKDEYEIPTTKDEYYSGVSYAPTEDIDVYISRGATTAFEKFIKFSEVKTLDAMERYSNGSFFKMMSDT